MDIRTNPLRLGCVTSSNAVKVMSNGKKAGEPGKPFFTYVKQLNYERKLGRPIAKDFDSKETSWGKLLEKRVFDELGTEYTYDADVTIPHPTISGWSGSPDGFKLDEGKTVVDFKSPYSLLSFCEAVECKDIQELRDNYDYGEKYYWQLVSNAILTDSKYAELIIYCPYQSELKAIRELAETWDGELDLKWLLYASDEELPYILDYGFYKNINILRFEVPQADKDALTERVLMATSLLTQ